MLDGVAQVCKMQMDESDDSVAIFSYFSKQFFLAILDCTQARINMTNYQKADTERTRLIDEQELHQFIGILLLLPSQNGSLEARYANMRRLHGGRYVFMNQERFKEILRFLTIIPPGNSYEQKHERINEINKLEETFF